MACQSRVKEERVPSRRTRVGGLAAIGESLSWYSRSHCEEV